jgi:hypothetical protein
MTIHLDTLDSLPKLAQTAVLRDVVQRLVPNPEVRAIWLGGSFAAGSADLYSDVDLRIAVAPDRLTAWRAPEWRTILNQDPIGATFLAFGENALLHHIVLEDGTIFDFFVQSTQHDNPEPAIKVLACGDEAFGERLAKFQRSAPVQSPPVEALTLSQALVDFWISSHKHRKVLGRDLFLVAVVGIQLERMMLLRLWHAFRTGCEMGGRPTIHGLTAATREIERDTRRQALQIVGMPLRDYDEIVAAIETARDEVARVGRQLAAREGFDYPQRLEQVVRQSWAEFRQSR